MIKSKFLTLYSRYASSLITSPNCSKPNINTKSCLLVPLNKNLIRNVTYGFFNIRKMKYRLQRLQQQRYPQFDAYFRLCRWDKPIGAMLLYWPTAWGVCIGSNGIADPYLLLLFLMGSWTARSAGCIVNDYFDREVDRQVERTKNRPLASGQVSLKQAGVLLFLNLCGGLFVLFHMTTPALITTFGFVGLSALYPLAKRYTNYPQFVLSLCFNSGIIIACLTANPTSFVPAMIPLYATGIAWTMIYDTIYAYQDIDDDLKIGVKSTAVTWRNNNPKRIMQQFAISMLIFHSLLPIIDIDFMYSYPIMLGCDLYLIKLIRDLDLKNKVACGKFFKDNNKIGGIIFGSLLLYGFVKAWRDYCLSNAQKN